MRGWFNRWFKSDGLNTLIAAVLAGYLKLVWHTSRFREVDGAYLDDTVARHGGVIFAFWHGRLALIFFALRPGMRLQPMVSRNRDGEIIAKVVQRFGISSVRGSSAKPGGGKDKGGAAALREMVASLRQGDQVGVTPDGPKGPRMRASDGVITMARLSGAPIVPVAYATSLRKCFNSWDRFLLPFPFSKGVFVFGPPIEVDRRMSEEAQAAARQRLEAALNDVTRRADDAVGQAPIDPAPLPSGSAP